MSRPPAPETGKVYAESYQEIGNADSADGFIEKSRHHYDSIIPAGANRARNAVQMVVQEPVASSPASRAVASPWYLRQKAPPALVAGNAA